MGLRFQRRLKIFPGVRLNFSKSGISTSIGTKGAWVTFGKKGTRTTIGIPGSGISYTEYQSKKNTTSRMNGKYIICPACHKKWPYHPAMENEELICTCKHRFYLDKKTINSTQFKASDIFCLILFLLIVGALIFGVVSCVRAVNEAGEKTKLDRSQSYASQLCKKEVWKEISKRNPESQSRNVNVEVSIHESEYNKYGSYWIFRGDFLIGQSWWKNKKTGTFYVEVDRIFLPRGEDTKLQKLEIKYNSL